MINSNQNPFSVYDFLGYFTPGATFLYCSLALYAHIAPEQINLFNSISITNDSTAEKYLFFVITSYLIGHILSLLSSWTIEQYLIKAYGHTSKYLLKEKTQNYFHSFEKSAGKWIRGILLLAILLPICLLDYLVGRKLEFRILYAKSLDKLLAHIIKLKIKHLLNNHGHLKFDSNEIRFKSADNDYFKYIYHYTLENTHQHPSKFQNYVTLYGLLRNITFVTLAFFWITLIAYTQNHENWNLLYLSLSIGALSFIFFIGYSKYMRRYAVEVLMAFSTTYTITQDNDQNK